MTLISGILGDLTLLQNSNKRQKMRVDGNEAMGLQRWNSTMSVVMEDKAPDFSLQSKIRFLTQAYGAE